VAARLLSVDNVHQRSTRDVPHEVRVQIFVCVVCVVAK